MKYVHYDLYQEVDTYDKYGNPKRDYEKIDTIRVAISIRNVRNVEGEILYKVKEITGITPYKNLEEKESYKLYVGSEPKYTVDSFIISRLTQLTLKEVI